MCSPCAEVAHADRKDVCIAVANIVNLPQPQLLGKAEVESRVVHSMQYSVDDDDYVTRVMINAAVASVDELINH